MVFSICNTLYTTFQKTSRTHVPKSLYLPRIRKGIGIAAMSWLMLFFISAASYAEAVVYYSEFNPITKEEGLILSEEESTQVSHFEVYKESDIIKKILYYDYGPDHNSVTTYHLNGYPYHRIVYHNGLLYSQEWFYNPATKSWEGNPLIKNKKVIKEIFKPGLKTPTAYYHLKPMAAGDVDKPLHFSKAEQREMVLCTSNEILQFVQCLESDQINYEWVYGIHPKTKDQLLYMTKSYQYEQKENQWDVKVAYHKDRRKKAQLDHVRYYLYDKTNNAIRKIKDYQYNMDGSKQLWKEWEYKNNQLSKIITYATNGSVQKEEVYELKSNSDVPEMVRATIFDPKINKPLHNHSQIEMEMMDFY